MKSSKRAFALLMTLIFALSSVFSFSATLAGAADFSDVADTNAYYEAITTLVEDGIINGYEDGTFKPDNTITRAEFSKLLATASAPSGTLFNATTTQFSDVADSTSSSAWAIPYIAYAVGVKAVNGYEDGTFRPTNTVTYGEAVKMIVCTLGYEPVVDKTLTPWYQGYLDIASQIGLNKSAFSQGDAPAPRGLVAQLIFNMRDCKPLVQTGVDLNGNPTWGTGDTSFSESKDNATEEEGIVLGVIDYALNGASVKKSQVLIGNQAYGIGKYTVDALKDMVGYSVTFMYNAKNEITNIRKQSGYNELFTVDADMIASVSDTSLAYYKNEDDEYNYKTTNISLDNMYVVYNGVPVNPADIGHGFDLAARLNVTDGKITFLSNDGNAKDAEVAFVESYVTYLANTPVIASGNATVNDLYPSLSGNTKSIVFDEDKEAYVITSKAGTPSKSTVASIKKNSVVSVAIPFGVDVSNPYETEDISVIFSNYYVTGSIEDILYEEEVHIGGNQYLLSPYFKKLKESNSKYELKDEDYGKFYLDRDGRIVFFEEIESNKPYAIAVRYKTGNSMDNNYEVALYVNGKGLKTFKLEDDVEINGTGMSASDAIAYLENTCPSSGRAVEYYFVQPIKYATNSKGNIDEIECMESTNDYKDGEIVPYKFKNSSHPTGGLFANGGSLSYSKDNKTFSYEGSNQFGVSGATVFLIPNDITAHDAYSKRDYGYFGDGSHGVEPYDVEGTKAKLVLCYLPEGDKAEVGIYASTPSYIICDKVDVREGDENYKKITYWEIGKNSSEPDSALVSLEVNLPVIDTLKAGDVVKFAFTDKKITKVKVIYNGGDDIQVEDVKEWKSGFTSNYISGESDKNVYEIIHGTVHSLTNGELTIYPELYKENQEFQTDWYTFDISDSVPCYEYNEKADTKVITGDFKGNILGFENDESLRAQASRIIAFVKDGSVKGIYILN